MWWKPSWCGYTPRTEEAGRYTFEEAAAITVPHVPPGEEVAVDERGAERFYEMLKRPSGGDDLRR